MKKMTALAGMILLFAAPLFAQNAAPPAVVPAASPIHPAQKAPAPAKAVGDQKGVEKLFADASEAWNAGDAKKMAGLFTQDSSLINPSGKQAHGRSEIEQLFTEELGGMMKGTQQTFADFSVRFYPLPNVALVDCTGTVTGLKNADGTDADPMPTHVFGVVVNRGGKNWQALNIRAYAFLKPMSQAAPAAPVVQPMAPGVSATPAMPSTDNIPPVPDFDAKKK